MDRVEIKKKAWELAKENLKKFWKGYAAVFGISFLCSLIIGILCNDKDSMFYNLLTIIVSFFTTTLSVGLYYYTLKIVRKDETEVKDIFKFVGNVLPIVAISFLMMIFVCLWSLLLIIPGIIVALGYSMVFFLYADNQSEMPMWYLSKSKEMMTGYKLDYFVFQLSFIGWALLCIVTLGIALIWAVPYVSIAEAIYYETLKNKKIS